MQGVYFYGVTSLAFPDNSLQTVGDSFMSSVYDNNSTLTSLTFGAGSLQSVGNDFL